MSIYILIVFSSLSFPFVSSTIQGRCNDFQSTTPKDISSWALKTTSPTASTPGSYMTPTPTTPSTPATHPSTPKTSLPITTCSMTSAPATTIWGKSYLPTSYCACNGGQIAGIGTTVGIDKSTTYTCEIDKTTLPPLTIVAPTNVPGEGGLPGCKAIASTTGTSAYCNCGGTPAPTLSPTASGFINCAYTIQPTSSYNPVIPTALPFAPGACNVQVWERVSETGIGPDTFITVRLLDANGMEIGHNYGGLNWDEVFETDSKLPWVMLVTPHTAMNKEMIVGPVSFANQPSMIKYPTLPGPSGEKPRKRLRSSSQEHNSQNEKLQTVGRFDKKKAKKKEGNGEGFLKSAAPLVTSKPPAPSVTSVTDEPGTQSTGNLISLLSKPTKTSTSIENGKEIDHILNTSSKAPYKMLGIDDNYNDFNTSTADKAFIASAFRHLSQRVHPDKNKDPRATKAFQKLNKAMKRLKLPNEAFAENAYSSSSDPLTDDNDDIDGHDQDGDIQMDDAPVQGTMPHSYHVKMYHKCTPYIHQLINDPRDHEAASAIERCNEKLKIYNQENGMHRKDCFIVYQGLVLEVVNAQEISKSFGKTATHTDKKYQAARKKIDEANQNIKKWVTSNHYPREWMVQFQLTRSAELEHTVTADSDPGDKSAVNGTPEPAAELQHADSGDESTSNSGSESNRIPFVIQPDEEKGIGVVLSGSKFGEEEVKAFLKKPNKPPDYGIQSRDFEFKDARYIDKVTFVGLRLEDDIIEDPDHCGAMAYLAVNIVTNVVGTRSLRDTGDRSATLGTINFSLLLASQPALIADLMGFSLRTYLYIHSTVSMVTSAQVLTHFLILLIEKQISIGSGTQLYGLLAAVGIGLILIFLILRRPCYELFIKSHHALAISGAAAFIITLVMHGISMLLSNISVHRPLPRTTIIPQKDSVTLKVSNIRPFKVRAGQFFQLRIPGVSVWSLFQNHPFAVVWWDEDKNGCATSLSFLVQVRSGFTAKLLQNASSNAAHLTWVDGPYGVPLDLRGYGCTLMFATGTGIAAQISYVKEILKQRWQWRSSMRNITLAWEVEHSSQLDWVRNWMQQLLEKDQGGYMLRIFLFMPNNTDAPSKYGIHDRIEVLPRNMNVGSLIDEEIRARSGKMLITVAATHKTRDEVRFAIMERTSASGLLSDQPAKVSSFHEQKPRMEVYVSNMQANMKDLIRSSREDPKDTVGQKVDKLVHSIQVFHRNVRPVSSDLTSRVHSIDLAELLFQPSRSYTMMSRRDV
ncbi:Genome polyprotein [Talaromyces islandicus]|uniref:Genome polyprotein n=1 Tax=Talaromyces islandicus TaxID=28573 RepID=A0A0U1MCH3_TALIS|nr:Genome polyprotein [Talaromyces islandicus]